MHTLTVQQSTTIEAVLGAEAATRMLIGHVSKHIAADALKRALTHLQAASHTELADAQPEQHCTARRIEAVADSLAEMILGLMEFEAKDESPISAADPDVLGIDSAAVLLDIHVVTLRRLASSGRVPARKVGREWRFSRHALHTWLAGEPPHFAEEARERERLTLQAASAGIVQRAVRQAASR